MTAKKVVLDGSAGEGGGQILRTSLSFSMLTGRQFRIENIRAGRKKPGLLRQHLTAVRAAAKISNAELRGAELGSRELTFTPREVTPGDYHFSVGTAGSATLVLQTVLPALMTAPGPSTLTLEGGTHNPWAPPFDFLTRVFLPLVRRMGPRVEATLSRYGFFPAGGGSFFVQVEPVEKLKPFEIMDRGMLLGVRAEACVARLPLDVARRELEVVRKRLNLDNDAVKPMQIENSSGPGNLVAVEVESENITERFTGFGRRGVTAEAVASQVADEAARYLEAEVPVGAYLADQLMLPMAMAGSGRFRTLKPSLHTETNRDTIRTFLNLKVDVEQESDTAWILTVSS